MSWQAEYSSEKIDVHYNDIPFAEYELLPEPFCQKCAAPIHPFFMRNRTSVQSCTNCTSLSGINRVYALGCYYVGPPYPQLTRHILDLKENRDKVKPLGTALASVIENRHPELTSIDALVPVPSHDTKFNLRGFNQADLLAIELSGLISKPVLDCLSQIKLYHQRGANRDDRFDNVRGAFLALDGLQLRISGKHLLLIDDVFTSGATISECSNVLLSSEARQVDALVLGRTCSR